MKALRIIGWFVAPYIMIFVSWKKINKPLKIAGIAWAFIAFVMVISNLAGGNKTPQAVEVSAASQSPNIKSSSTPAVKDTPAATIKPSSKPTNTPIPTVDPAVQKKKDQQAIVLQFEQTIYDTEKPATVAIKNYQAVFQEYGAGTATINDAYQAATDANKACSDVQYAMGTLSTPSGLPKDVKNSLSGATEDISTSYYTTTEALDQILKYLDDQKPSYVQKYKDDMAMANSFIVSGVTKIFQAKSEMGIDITAASPSA